MVGGSERETLGKSAATTSATTEPEKPPEWQFQSILKKSLFGYVYLMKDINSSEEVVVKRSNKANVESKHCAHEHPKLRVKVQVHEDVCKEAKLHQRIQDFASENNLAGANHICRLLSFIDSEEHYLTVLEYCSRGDVYDVLRRRGSLSVRRVKNFFYQTALGLSAIHRAGVAHLDLSVENLLVSHDQQIKICDFGLAEECPPGTMLQGIYPGKERYLAPEILYSRRGFDGQLADMWSLGVILFVLLTGINPYKKPSKNDVRFTLVWGGHLRLLLSGWKFQVSDQPGAGNIPLDAFNLLDGLLRPRRSRLTLKQVLAHPWLRNVSDDDGRTIHVDSSPQLLTPTTEQSSSFGGEQSESMPHTTSDLSAPSLVDSPAPSSPPLSSCPPSHPPSYCSSSASVSSFSSQPSCSAGSSCNGHMMPLPLSASFATNLVGSTSPCNHSLESTSSAGTRLYSSRGRSLQDR